MTISYAEIPYFQTDDDKKACVISGERMIAALKANPEISLVKPASNQTVMEYVNSVSPPLSATSLVHCRGPSPYLRRIQAR